MSELRHFRFSGYSSTSLLARITTQLAGLVRQGLGLEDIAFRAHYGFFSCDLVMRLAGDAASGLAEKVAEALKLNALTVPQLSNTRIFELRRRFERNPNSHLRVLLIDDEAADLLPKLATAGQEAGWSITWYTAATEAEARTKLFDVDLILLDIMFVKEVRDATTSLKILEAISENPHMRPPVFVISSQPHWDDGVMSDYWSRGAWRFVHKPILLEGGGLGMLLATLLGKGTVEMAGILAAEEPVSLLATVLSEAAAHFIQVLEISVMPRPDGESPRVVMRLSASDAVRPEELLRCIAKRIAEPGEDYGTEALVSDPDIAGDGRRAIGQRAWRWLARLNDPGCSRKDRLAAHVAFERNVRVHSWEIYRQVHSL